MAVPIKYKHNWKYTGRWSETKVAPGKWRIRFRATKGRRVGSKTRGGPKVGFKIRWKINAIQDAIKTSRGTYQTDLRGTKTSLSAGYKRRKKLRRRKY